MFTSKKAILLALFLLSLTQHTSAADRIILNNNDILRGTLVGARDGVALLRTQYAGVVPIRMTDIVDMETDGPVMVYLKDQTNVLGVIRKGRRDTLKLITADPANSRNLTMDQILTIGISPESDRAHLLQATQMSYPQGSAPAATDTAKADTASASSAPAKKAEPKTDPSKDAPQKTDLEAPKPPSWKGYLTAGYSLISGNTEKTTANTQITLERTIESMRYALNGRYNSSEENGEMTERKASASAKADYFLSDHHYLYATEEVKYDQFKDLDLMSATGVGFGWKLFHDDRKTLELEAGATYICETYEEAPTDTHMAGRGSIKAGYKLNHRINVTDTVIMYPSFEDAQYQITNEFQVHFKMDDHWGFCLTNLYEYDSTPAEKNKREDITTTVGVRYDF